MTHSWHPSADMRQVAGNEPVIVLYAGVWIYDATRVVGGRSLQTCPPYVITTDEIGLLGDRIAAAIA